ncbi:collagen alpha-1(I) chain-like [Manis pentadactyla]|uniref:collagen alpha-1(I) chain-like n=1 Tax=Manis pentadactyla TaxID=143292 RepID=UPI00255C49BF|nr:collagen alpha-1(I) chain-like [Manis pentadactyla]
MSPDAQPRQRLWTGARALCAPATLGRVPPPARPGLPGLAPASAGRAPSPPPGRPRSWPPQQPWGDQRGGRLSAGAHGVSASRRPLAPGQSPRGTLPRGGERAASKVTEDSGEPASRQEGQATPDGGSTQKARAPGPPGEAASEEAGSEKARLHRAPGGAGWEAGRGGRRSPPAARLPPRRRRSRWGPGGGAGLGAEPWGGPGRGWGRGGSRAVRAPAGARRARGWDRPGRARRRRGRRQRAARARPPRSGLRLATLPHQENNNKAQNKNPGKSKLASFRAAVCLPRDRRGRPRGRLPGRTERAGVRGSAVCMGRWPLDGDVRAENIGTGRRGVPIPGYSSARCRAPRGGSYGEFRFGFQLWGLLSPPASSPPASFPSRSGLIQRPPRAHRPRRPWAGREAAGPPSRLGDPEPESAREAGGCRRRVGPGPAPQPPPGLLCI